MKYEKVAKVLRRLSRLRLLESGENSRDLFFSILFIKISEKSHNSRSLFHNYSLLAGGICHVRKVPKSNESGAARGGAESAVVPCWRKSQGECRWRVNKAFVTLKTRKIE